MWTRYKRNILLCDQFDQISHPFDHENSALVSIASESHIDSVKSGWCGDNSCEYMKRQMYTINVKKHPPYPRMQNNASYWSPKEVFFDRCPSISANGATAIAQQESSERSVSGKNWEKVKKSKKIMNQFMPWSATVVSSWLWPVQEQKMSCH